LNALKVDWLVEKFGELSDDAQRLFVKRDFGGIIAMYAEKN
jgi:hypothetical protein